MTTRTNDTTTDRHTESAGWDRRRLIAVLGTVATVVLILVFGLGYAIYLGFTTAGDTTATSPDRHHEPGLAATDSNRPAEGQQRRDEIAAAPMLKVEPDDRLPTEPATVSAASITIAAPIRTGLLAVPTGFPHTPGGAAGQLAAIETTVLQAMSIAQAGDVYIAWAMPGGTGPASWEITRNVQAFLGAAQMGAEKSIAAVVVAEPAAAILKGVDGPDWATVCVLLKIRATITTDAQMGYGYCERMQWDPSRGGRWMIAPGSPPAKAPSTWPGSKLALKAGWLTWVQSDTDDTGAGQAGPR